MLQAETYVDICWVRHGYSCANLAEDNIIENDTTEMTPGGQYAPDAILTDYGIKQASNVGRINREFFDSMDIVVSSELRRAIETALALVDNDRKIYVVPYINEVRSEANILNNTDRDNMTNGIEQTKKYIASHHVLNDVDFSILESMRSTYGNGQIRANVKKFFDISLPKLLAMCKRKNPKFLRTTKLLIVTHQNFIASRISDLASLCHGKSHALPINNTDFFVERIKIINNGSDTIYQNLHVNAPFPWQKINDYIYQLAHHHHMIDNEESYRRCGNILCEKINSNKYENMRE